MWEKPWKYKEGILAGASLLATGMLLQASVGGIDWGRMAFPVNVIVLCLFLLALTVMNALRRKVYLFAWLSQCSTAVSSLCYVLGMTVLMGLVRQSPSGGSGMQAWLTDMLSFWPFVLVYVWMTVVLGMTILRAGLPFRWRRLPFLLNHIGLFTVILAGTAGGADMRRLRMTVPLGGTEWRAQDEKTGQMVELTLAIELKDFTIDEYPPKLMLIDNSSGRLLPEKTPVHLLLEEGVSGGRLMDWDISVTESLPEAACFVSADSLKFTGFHSPGSAYAVRIEAINRISGEQKGGWVSCGSFLFPYKALMLDERTSVVMPDREPRRFASEVIAYTDGGLRKRGTIEVNKPLDVGGWKIYQLSYDETRGRWSEISVFELVRDSWLLYVYIGMIMMIGGAVGLFVAARPRTAEEERK